MMKPTLCYGFNLLLILFSSVAITGCDPVYYKPNRVNAPMLSDAKQAQVTLSTNNTQLAYSPYKNIGVMGGYSRFRFNDEGTFGKEKVNFFEAGAGYYHRLDTFTMRKTGFWVYDIYGGYGMGKIDIDNNATSTYPSMNISRIFIQPGLGYRARIFEFSFNWRFASTQYNNFSLPASDKTPVAGRSYLFSEPAITVRAGYKAVKLELQYVNSAPISNVHWTRNRDALNIGLSVLINGYR